MRALDALPRIAELSVNAARQAGSLAVSAVRTIAGPIVGRRSDDGTYSPTRNWEAPPSPRSFDDPPPPPPSSFPRSRATTPPPPPADPPPAPPPAASRPAAPPAPAPQPEPAHVDSDAVIVAQSADAGAADGAGAEVHVDEPWGGYAKLTAKDVTAQLATADAAMLAVVRLYESKHRNRRTVLAAIDHRLATADR